MESDTRDRSLQRKEGWLEIEKRMALSLATVAAAGNDLPDQGQGGRTSVEEGDKEQRGCCWTSRLADNSIVPGAVSERGR